jgi:hypothetical protein
MITEDYVSLETAKLLKEKGFDSPCTVWYAESTSYWGGDPSGDRTYRTVQYDDKNKSNPRYKLLFYIPTLQMAMKWLREVYGLFIRITEDMTGKVFEWSVYQKNYGCKASTYVEDSYEDACESAIKYCLENLI